MLSRTITVSGQEVKFKSSAAIPRLYRAKFKRDIFKDLSKLEAAYSSEQDAFKITDLEVFENIAYIMALHAEPDTTGSIEKWLDQFDMFSIYEVLPQILHMWAANTHTDSEAKKN